MAACREAGVRVVVLDRPNPIGGVQVEGNRVITSYSIHYTKLYEACHHWLWRNLRALAFSLAN